MTIGTKTFAKKAACAPETLTAADFESFAGLFTPDEKVHIVLLAAEARKQAALLYGLSAVMKHMSGGDGDDYNDDVDDQGVRGEGVQGTNKGGGGNGASSSAAGPNPAGPMAASVNVSGGR